jgi:hypothetical protein
MKVVESSPDQERLDLIKGTAEDAAKLLGIDLVSDSPQSIMVKVNDAIVDLVLEKPSPVSEDENPDLLLGCLWGAQMVRQFGWYWTNAVIDDEFDEVAVISPNQEMIIFPLSFASACITKQCICTVLLAFNMLLEGRHIGQVSAGAYENIMLHIHHIGPPYELEPSA